MILTRAMIKEKLKSKQIIIMDPHPSEIGPNSVDLHLSNEIFLYTQTILDPRRKNEGEFKFIPEEGILLYPGQLYLGSTEEWTETQKLVPMLEGISSNARLGIQVHVSAGFGDIGFKGCWTLEIVVHKVVRVYPGMRIAQIYYIKPLGDIEDYDGRYQNSAGTVQSKSFEKE